MNPRESIEKKKNQGDFRGEPGCFSAVLFDLSADFPDTVWGIGVKNNFMGFFGIETEDACALL
jgi:hypothetical protein